MIFSYQLYSSRNWPLSAGVKMIADAGYGQVEGYGALYKDALAVNALEGLLEETGLSMPTAHIGLDMVEETPELVIDIARRLGITALFGPYLGADERPADAQGWRDFGTRLQNAGAPLRDAGLTFGWHNHDFEFTPLADGSLPMTHIFAGGPALSWEADIAWIARGGADPHDWIDSYGARIVSVHIKDIASPGECEDEDGWADVGHGTMNWPALMARLRDTPAKYFVMEHDNPNDHERFARRSLVAAKTF